MSAEVWAIISVGIVILIAMATSHRALRQEMNVRMTELRQELGGRIDVLGERVTDLRTELIEGFGKVNERITAVRGELINRIADLRGELIERLSHVEGLLEGIGHVLHKRAAKERRDSEHRPAPP